MKSVMCSKPRLPWLREMKLGRVCAPAEDWEHSTHRGFQIPGVSLGAVHPFLLWEPDPLPHSWCGNQTLTPSGPPWPSAPLCFCHGIFRANLGRGEGFVGSSRLWEEQWSERESSTPCLLLWWKQLWCPEPEPPLWNRTKSLTAIKKGLKRVKLFQTCM